MVGKLLTIREVSNLLDITEKEVIDLAEKGTIPAYKVGGVYLRFKREQIEKYIARAEMGKQELTPRKVSSPSQRLSDFFYFYDFYILSAIALIVLFIFIIKG